MLYHGLKNGKAFTSCLDLATILSTNDTSKTTMTLPLTRTFTSSDTQRHTW